MNSIIIELLSKTDPGCCRGDAVNENARAYRRKRWRFIGISIVILIAMFAPPIAAAQNSCIDCHESLGEEPLTPEAHQFREIREAHTDKGISCSLACHESIFRVYAINNYQEWKVSSHATAGVACDKCHGGNPEESTKEGAHIGLELSTDPQSGIYYTHIHEVCGKCHQDVSEIFVESEHFEKLEGTGSGPSCSSCHLVHNNQAAYGYERMKDLCVNCHNENTGTSPEVIARAKTAFDLTESLDSAIEYAEAAIVEAEESGRDVTQAKESLDAAREVRSKIPAKWHIFDLITFDRDVLAGIDLAENALSEATGETPTPTTTATDTPGFIAISWIIGVFLVLYYINRRRKE